MDNRELLSAIEKEIRVLDTHITRLRNKAGEVHDIDIDVLADRLKALYAMVLELVTAASVEAIPGDVENMQRPPVSNPEIGTVPEPETKPGPKPEIETVSKPEIQTVPKPEMETVSKPEMETVSKPEIATAPKPEIEFAPKPEIEPEPKPGSLNTPEPLTDPEPEPRNPEPKLTADLFSGPTTIADAYQAEEDKSIAARVVPQAVDDLKRAIGINDKFLFINELFKGSPGEYNEAIDRLNASATFDAAREAMDQYRNQYDWAEQSEAYHRLKKIVFAKFNGS